MKWYPTLTGALLFVSLTTLTAEAQTKLPPRRPVQPRPKAAAPVGVTMKDGFMMKEGKVMVTRDAHTEALGAETSVVNGTKINPTGTVTMPDGTTAVLKEGDYMSLTGRLTTMAMKAEQDSLMQLAKNGKGKVKMKKK
ncbi:DUF6799 domain-containing protein [Hymenobacter endophyticus]|uniref:DUF6799 domain-containing protein n=1 Tax=Hymenobacter endophyticus TaxID=3076335 RepID=A0ABU3TGY1_9BACT|nr:DUF6799 domain-containing protein [Hymenobacter endophyticus]MDU0370617.1 DUF6799 domain-containing protein [Hymenobacter endophyticus]